MFLNRKLHASNPPKIGRIPFVPPPPADEPQPDSPASDHSSLFEGRKETATPLRNPWPPTPPQTSPSSSTLFVNDLSSSQEKLIPSAAYVSCGRDLNHFFVLNGFFCLQEAWSTGWQSTHPNILSHRRQDTDVLHDRVCHSSEIRSIIHADNNLKRHPHRGQAKPLHLLLIVQGRRCTPEYLRTRHSQTRIRPSAAHVQRLVRHYPNISIIG